MQFQKILSYDPYTSEHLERFRGVCTLLTQTRDPHTLCPQQLDAQGKHVFISPRLRATETLAPATAASVETLTALNEIPFALERYCDAAYFKTHGSTAVREAFLHLFVHDTLAVSRTQLQRELDELIILAAEHPGALAISHTFRLRLLESYLRSDRQIFTQPECIYDHLDPTQHWLDFGATLSLPKLL